jgi:hypothetical protein
MKGSFSIVYEVKNTGFEVTGYRFGPKICHLWDV